MEAMILSRPISNGEFIHSICLEHDIYHLQPIEAFINNEQSPSELIINRCLEIKCYG